VDSSLTINDAEDEHAVLAAVGPQAFYSLVLALLQLHTTELSQGLLLDREDELACHVLADAASALALCLRLLAASLAQRPLHREPYATPALDAWPLARFPEPVACFAAAAPPQAELDRHRDVVATLKQDLGASAALAPLVALHELLEAGRDAATLEEHVLLPAHASWMFPPPPRVRVSEQEMRLVLAAATALSSLLEQVSLEPGCRHPPHAVHAAMAGLHAANVVAAAAEALDGEHRGVKVTLDLPPPADSALVPASGAICGLAGTCLQVRVQCLHGMGEGVALVDDADVNTDSWRALSTLSARNEALVASVAAAAKAVLAGSQAAVPSSAADAELQRILRGAVALVKTRSGADACVRTILCNRVKQIEVAPLLLAAVALAACFPYDDQPPDHDEAQTLPRGYAQWRTPAFTSALTAPALATVSLVRDWETTCACNGDGTDPAVTVHQDVGEEDRHMLDESFTSVDLSVSFGEGDVFSDQNDQEEDLLGDGSGTESDTELGTDSEYTYDESFIDDDMGYSDDEDQDYGHIAARSHAHYGYPMASHAHWNVLHTAPMYGMHSIYVPYSGHVYSAPSSIVPPLPRAPSTASIEEAFSDDNTDDDA
jgi:hypothetical protein